MIRLLVSVPRPWHFFSLMFFLTFADGAGGGAADEDEMVAPDSHSTHGGGQDDENYTISLKL